MIVVSRGNIDESGQLSSSSDDPLADNGFKNSLKVQNKKKYNCPVLTDIVELEAVGWP